MGMMTVSRRLARVSSHFTAANPDTTPPGRRCLPGRTLSASDIIFGGIHIGPSDGARSQGAWGRTATQQAATEVVRAALEAGIHDFDTAPMYGNGAAEERLGGALVALAAQQPELAARARVTTKTGRLVRSAGLPPEHRELVADYSAAGARLSHAESLVRMGLHRCFGLRVHDCDGAGAPPSADCTDAVLAPVGGHLCGLRELREAGEVVEVSLGMNTHMGFGRGPPYVLRLLREAPAGTFDTALLAGGWNLLNTEGWGVLCECALRGVRVHVAGVFGGTGQADNRNLFAPSERWAPTVAAWERLGAQNGVSLADLAIAFATLPRAVDKVVLGMASVGEVERNVASIEAVQRVPSCIWHRAVDEGLLPADIVEGLMA
jgi:D-threo-aldose 1-dehydrogenase